MRGFGNGWVGWGRRVIGGRERVRRVLGTAIEVGVREGEGSVGEMRIDD